ncbi:hypothetical protein RJT34_12611 [Clitoria ternatea]|uniref:Uncharacterized protein n=1 Tax=Clitoria ternatea TaxID=43366 RepID=A0AAN9JP55_CLITE
MGTHGRAIYNVGFWIRETGQAIDCLGSCLQELLLSRSAIEASDFDECVCLKREGQVLTEGSPSHYRGTFHVLSIVFLEESPQALYKGWLPSVIRVIPYVGLNFYVYESLKDWLVHSKPFGIAQDSKLSVTTRLACGAVVGIVGQTMAYLLDVIHRRMQMMGWKMSLQ